jgi:hypothetical protein
VRLEELLGSARPGGSLADEYRFHLAFATEVGERAQAGGARVRDMLDVSLLVCRAARYEFFWSGGMDVDLDPIPAVEPAHPPPPRAGEPAYLAVCAIYRDEAPYLREWIEFHRLVGVERFFLYDHESVDAHLAVLAPYLEGGIVEVSPAPEFPWQTRSYTDCLQRHADDARWIAFIDIDEFLFSPLGRPVSDVLREYERWPGVGVNWVNFGSSGHRDQPPGLVIGSYPYRAISPDGERTVKSVVDPTRAVRALDAHSFDYRDGHAVDERRRAITGDPRFRSESASVERLRINHYTTKSESEWRKKRERVAVAFGKPRPPRDPLHGIVRDEVVQTYVPLVKRRLAAAS